MKASCRYFGRDEPCFSSEQGGESAHTRLSQTLHELNLRFTLKVRTPHSFCVNRLGDLNYSRSAHHTPQNSVTFESSKPCTCNAARSQQVSLSRRWGQICTLRGPRQVLGPYGSIYEPSRHSRAGIGRCRDTSIILARVSVGCRAPG